MESKKYIRFITVLLEQNKYEEAQSNDEITLLPPLKKQKIQKFDNTNNIANISETNESNFQPELNENLMDEDVDFENNERMLEGDYDIYTTQFRARYIEEKLKKETKK